MNQQLAGALVMYLQRANSLIPTTGAEWSHIVGAIDTIEGVANGVIQVEIKPARPAETRSDVKTD